jgi:hypothetical protein
VLDDFSRFVVAWKLCATMKAEDVTATLDLALAASGLDQVKVRHRPRLLSDNGSSYIAGDLAEWLEDKGMTHIRGAPRHPQTQGKIERWHQTLKNRILLEHHYLPGALEEQVGAFVEHYNHAAPTRACATSRPADVYFGRGEAILAERERIKHRRLKLGRWHFLEGREHPIEKRSARQSVWNTALQRARATSLRRRRSATTASRTAIACTWCVAGPFSSACPTFFFSLASEFDGTELVDKRIQHPREIAPIALKSLPLGVGGAEPIREGRRLRT